MRFKLSTGRDIGIGRAKPFDSDVKAAGRKTANGIGGLCAIGLCFGSGTALAQGVTELPGIVVQGATIEAPRAVPPKAPPTPQPTPQQSVQSASPQPAPQQQQQAAPVQTVSASGGAGGNGGNGDASAEPVADAAASFEGEGNDSGAAGLPIVRTGTSVSVVTGAQLQAQQIRYASDALRSLPGVSVSRNSTPGSVTQVRIRGAEGNHTLVVIDGIRANDSTNGEYDFSNLSADDIERIEVLRGPQSGLYGSNALGGVINIITKSGKGPLTLTMRGEAGSFATKDGSIRVSGGNDWVWGSASYQRRETEGFNIAPEGDEADESRFTTFAFKGGVQLAPGIVLDLVARDSRNISQFDDFGGTAGSFGDVTGLNTAVDADNTLDHHVRLGGATLRWDMLDGQLTHKFSATINQTEFEDQSATFLSSNKSDTRKFAYAATFRFDTPALFGAKHFVTGLAERETELFTPNSSSAFSAGDGIERERNRKSFAAEYRGEFADQFFVSGTIRRDNNDTFDDYTTWRATASWKVPGLGLRPHGSAGTAVKNPTMFEQFGSLQTFFASNPELQPEESFGWDAGAEVTFAGGAAVIDVTYFKQRLKNKIDAFANVLFFPRFAFQPDNLDGKSRRSGVEVSGRFRLTPQLTLGASYSYLKARDADGVEEIRRAPHSGRTDLTYKWDGGRGTFNLAAIYNGKMTDSAFQGVFPFGRTVVTLDDYWLVSAAASYKVTKEVELFGRVENLLDQDYQEVFGFETAPLAAYAGVKLKFTAPEVLE